MVETKVNIVGPVFHRSKSGAYARALIKYLIDSNFPLNLYNVDDMSLEIGQHSIRHHSINSIHTLNRQYPTIWSIPPNIKIKKTYLDVLLLTSLDFVNLTKKFTEWLKDFDFVLVPSEEYAEILNNRGINSIEFYIPPYLSSYRQDKIKEHLFLISNQDKYLVGIENSLNTLNRFKVKYFILEGWYQEADLKEIIVESSCILSLSPNNCISMLSLEGLSSGLYLIDYYNNIITGDSIRYINREFIKLPKINFWQSGHVCIPEPKSLEKSLEQILSRSIIPNESSYKNYLRSCERSLRTLERALCL